MNTAERWQDALIKLFSDVDIVILNPRRDDWDSSWVQDMSNKKFRQQVEWELSAMEQANTIAFYFDPSTKSPITLLELGLWARSRKVIVCCPEGFWRKGNVDIVCAYYQIPQYQTLAEFGEGLRWLS